MKTLATALLLSVLLAAPPARAQFLKPGSVDWKSILSPPPAPDSPECKKEIDQMIALQAGHTPDDADVARALREVKMNPFIFSDVLGSWFNPDDLPKTAKFLGRITRDIKSVTDPAKDEYARLRPFKVDSRIKLLVTREDSFSYPSNHSTRATVWALVLAKMLPDQKDALIARSRQIGDDRALGGVHFPTDVEAGRKLGAEIFRQMSNNPDFAAQLEKAAQECQSHRKPN